MPSSGMWHRVALVRTNVSGELIASFINVNVVPSSPILPTLMTVVIRSYASSILTRATWRQIPEDGILCSHRRENF
jgi:hypothetical protein